MPYSAARRRVLQAFIFALVLIWGLTALYTWQDRRETIGRGEERALAFAALTDAFVHSRLREVDAGLRELLSHDGDGASLRHMIDVHRRLLRYLDGWE